MMKLEQRITIAALFCKITIAVLFCILALVFWWAYVLSREPLSATRAILIVHQDTARGFVSHDPWEFTIKDKEVLSQLQAHIAPQGSSLFGGSRGTWMPDLEIIFLLSDGTVKKASISVFNGLYGMGGEGDWKLTPEAKAFLLQLIADHRPTPSIPELQESPES